MKIIAAPEYLGHGESYEKDSSFLARLKSYDPCLEAVKDYHQNEIIIWASRRGQRVHELTYKREYAELWVEVEARILKDLPTKDVWRNFGVKGGGAKFSDHLEDLKKQRKEKLKKEEDERLKDWVSENKHEIDGAIENAKAGRFHKETVKPYNHPVQSFPENPLAKKSQEDK